MPVLAAVLLLAAWIATVAQLLGPLTLAGRRLWRERTVLWSARVQGLLACVVGVGLTAFLGALLLYAATGWPLPSHLKVMFEAWSGSTITLTVLVCAAWARDRLNAHSLLRRLRHVADPVLAARVASPVRPSASTVRDRFLLATAWAPIAVLPLAAADSDCSATVWVPAWSAVPVLCAIGAVLVTGRGRFTGR